MELVNKDNVKAKEVRSGRQGAFTPPQLDVPCSHHCIRPIRNFLLFPPQGWKLDPTTSTPVFPIIARPDHPLPPLPIKESAKKASASSSVKDAKKLKKEGQKDKKVKDTLPPEPPNRARRVKIDSTQWKPSHAREEDLVKRYGDTIPRPATALSLQEQEEAGSDSNAESSSTSDGTLSEDDDDDDDDDSEAIEPLTEEPGKIKLDQDNAGDDASDSEDSQESEGPDATLATDIESTVKEDSDESKAERQRLLAIAASFATQPPAVPLENAIDRADAEGDASLSEESESEEDEVEPVARDATASSLQPPIGDSEDVEDQVSEAEEEEVQDEQENHEGRSDDDASSADNDADMADASSTNPRVGMANVQMQSLTDMFRPQESAGEFTNLGCEGNLSTSTNGAITMVITFAMFNIVLSWFLPWQPPR